MQTIKTIIASCIKFLMGLVLLTALFGVPYLVIASTWGWIVDLWHTHPVWCVLLVIPICVLAGKVMKWTLQATGHVLMGIGGNVDVLEKDSPT